MDKLTQEDISDYCHEIKRALATFIPLAQSEEQRHDLARAIAVICHIEQQQPSDSRQPERTLN